MKFERTLSRATIKKQIRYTFPEISDNEISEGMTRKFDNPLYINKKGYGLYALYIDSGRLCVVMYHSYDTFKEDKEIAHSQQGNASSVKGLRMQTDHAGKHDAGKQGLVGQTAPNPADANELRKNIKLLGEGVNLNSAEGEGK